jgi:uncharacterized protein
MRRIEISLLILSLLVLAVSCDSGSETSALLSYVSNPRLSSETRIFDNAGLIINKKSLDADLKALYEMADIDMVVVTFTDLQSNDIDDIANRLFSNWKIGKDTNGQKGILFLLSVDEELVRFEIGHDLKWIYPDSFVGYIERDQMAPYFESRRIQTGINATLEMIIARANEEIEGGLSY